MFSAVFSGQAAAQEPETTAVSHLQDKACPIIKLKDSCKKLLAGTYEVRGRGAVRLIANPHWNAKTDLSMYGSPCRVKLERPWALAPGSFHSSFLNMLATKGDAGSCKLLAIVDKCNITYRIVDTVCAPSMPGRPQRPCTERHVSDWLFCQICERGYCQTG